MQTKSIAYTVLLTALGLVAPMAAMAPAGSAPVSSSSSSEAELCFGQVPTIMGTAGKQVIGTEGPDVVVTNGAAGADTLAGDDLLCITGMSDSFSFKTGAGSDRIDSSESKTGWFLDIAPGLGPDEFYGGSADEKIRASARSVADRLGDTIRAGSGNDYVLSGGDVGNHDRIDVGPGRDIVSVWGTKSVDAELDGGPGRDKLRIRHLERWGGDWVVDNRHGLATRGEKMAAQWSSFSDFDLDLRGDLSFLGGSVDETLDVAYPKQWFLHTGSWVDLRMGGGDDTMVTMGGARDSRYDGGVGDDTFRVPARGWGGQMRFDLAAGTFRLDDRFGPHTKVATNFENATLVPDPYATGGPPIILLGTDGPNRLIIEGHLFRTPAALYGRAGNDLLRGGPGDDLVVGGPGYDTAFGSRGFDRCVTEVRNACERL